MILGFSHLTHATAAADRACAYWLERGWRAEWSAPDVVSAPEKWPLMRRRAMRHDLHMLAGPVRIEVIAHDSGSTQEPGRLSVSAQGGVVEIATRDPAREARFFREAMRFVEGEDDVLSFSGRMPSWSVSVRPVLNPRAPVDPPLDLEGVASLAFLSTAPAAEAEAMAALGARDVGTPFRIAVNGRALTVVMLRSPEGVPIELVKIEVKP